jgi:hypothetical protein
MQNGTAPKEISIHNFPPPFLSHDKDFVKEYDKLIKTFQTQIMELCMSRVNQQLNAFKEKITNIKTYLKSKNVQDVYSKLDNIKINTENTWKSISDTAMEKAQRIIIKSYTVRQINNQNVSMDEVWFHRETSNTQQNNNHNQSATNVNENGTNTNNNQSFNNHRHRSRSRGRSNNRNNRDPSNNKHRSNSNRNRSRNFDNNQGFRNNNNTENYQNNRSNYNNNSNNGFQQRNYNYNRRSNYNNNSNGFNGSHHSNANNSNNSSNNRHLNQNRSSVNFRSPSRQRRFN